MLKDITKVKISGAMFSTSTTLEFFNPHDGDKLKTVKGVLLYGRNGTGKSTIAKAFRKLGGEPVPGITGAIACDDANRLVSLNEEDKKHIFVFDEDFVDHNVKLRQDHLETIVMLGQAADLTEKIEKAETARDTAKNAFEKQEAIYQEYCDAGNVKSPKHYIILLGNALRGTGNWADRDREIHSARQNTSVRDDTYKRFLQLTPVKTKAELITDYRDKMKELEAAKTGASIIDKKVPTIPKAYSAYDDVTVRLLLAEVIDEPELSEREKKLLSLLYDGKAQELSQRLELFRKEETTECPFCYQSMTLQYKESLVESIKKVLSKKVEDHQKALRSHIIEPIVLELAPYTQLEGYQTCVDLLAETNALIQGCNDNLKKKIDSPYAPIVAEDTMIKDLVARLNTYLESLETARVVYNKKAVSTTPIVAELDKINGEIAYYDIVDLAAQLEKQEEAHAAAKGLHDILKVAYETKKNEVEELEAQRKNVRLAIDSINACMKYIFFADDRLKIDYVDGKYKLLSHGKNVKPCDVSVGERNIIGLCYFFTSIFEGKDEKDAHKEEYLLVIDDPVSSYDIENRIGILSFIKYKLSVFLEGNQNTRALVMTHDLKTFYDTYKIFEEIMEACKQKGYQHGPKFNRFEMREGSLKQFMYKSRQEYTEIVEVIYKYALGQGSEYELVIGNLMRQALEAFSTFEYKKSIDEVSTDAQILSLLPGKEYVAYYKNLMYRLILHGGSHREEQIKTMNDFRFFSVISEEEKRRTAKDILCFIYLLNSRHLLQHLQSSKNVEAELKSWCLEIKARSAVI